MSPALPIPSKGALRALRRLALGTSCTVAFGAGIITEDRRRRIHSVREVQENGLRIKTARKYHSGGTSIAATFDEQVMTYGNYGGLKVKEGGLEYDDIWADVLHDRKNSRKKRNVDTVQTASNTPAASPELLHYNAERLAVKAEPPISTAFAKQDEKMIAVAHNVEIRNQHQDLATRMRAALNLPDNRLATALARDIFRRGYKSCSTVETFGPPVLEACVLLGQRHQEAGNFEDFVPIIEQLLSLGPVTMELGTRLGVTKAAAAFLERSGCESSKGPHDLSLLRRAHKLYTARYLVKPTALNAETYAVGRRMCAAALQMSQFKMAVELFWWMNERRGNLPLQSVSELLLAEHAQGNYKKVLRGFVMLFSDTNPQQDKFYRVVGAAVDIALDIRDLNQAFEILEIAAEMAVQQNLVLSTTWLLKVLQSRWEQSKDLVATSEVFEKLLSISELSSHPQALHSAIIQISLQAGDEIVAERQLERFHDAFGEIDVQTRGYLALSQAKKGDWEGVERSFISMHEAIGPESTAAYMNSFVAILKEYAMSHSVTETESFLHLYVGTHGILPNQAISKEIVAVYAKAGEIDSIVRWIEFATPLGFVITADIYNQMLKSLQRKWHFSTKRLYDLCVMIKRIDTTLINRQTLLILRSSVGASGGKAGHASVWLPKIDRLLKESSQDQSVCSRTRMSDALSKGMPGECLHIYVGATRSSASITPEMVTLAVEACIRSPDDGGISRAIDIIREAKNVDVDISSTLTSLMIHQLNDHQDSEDVRKVVNQTIFLLDQKNLRFPMHAASKVASTLVDRGDHRLAVELWSTLWKSHKHRREYMDIISLTVLLKAYIRLYDVEGIQWVVKSVSQNQLVPDLRFKSHLKNFRKELRHKAENQPNDMVVREKLDVVEDCWQDMLQVRAHGMLDRDAAERKAILMIGLANLENSKRGKTARNTVCESAKYQTQPMQQQQQRPLTIRREHEIAGHDAWETTGHHPWVEADVYGVEAAQEEIRPHLVAATG